MADGTALLDRAHLQVLARTLGGALDRTSLAWLALALFVVTCGGLSASLAPLALKGLVDRLAEPGAGKDLTGLGPALLAYVAALLLQRLSEQTQVFAYALGEQRLVRRFGGQAFAHILSLPLGFHLDRRSGALTQALADGVMGFRMVLNHLSLSLAPVAVQIVVTGLVLASVCGPLLGLVLICALIAYAAVFAAGVSRLSEPVRGISTAQGEVGGATADSLMNIEAIKAYAAEPRFARRYDQLLAETEGRWSLFVRRRLENGVAVTLVFALAVAAVHALAGAQAAGGRISLGTFVLINAFLLQLVRPIEALGFAVRDIGQGLAYLDRIAEVLLQAPEPGAPAWGAAAPQADAPQIRPGPADLRFEGVSLALGGRQTLSGLSFHAAPGALVAIVGPSGAGKSSLLKLILRFHAPDAGRILLDGRPLSDLPLADLRRQIALVSQDTILFNDTLAENIGLAEEAADLAAITAAAARAHLDTFLADLPEGLQTRVGERGLKLSGGEKQRVSIARAALKQARLVILDEATSALDPVTERAVWTTMRGLAEGATTLVVTHRLSTVAAADEILVLDRGRIAERGRHADLLAQQGVYATLWRAQRSAAPITPPGAWL